MKKPIWALALTIALALGVAPAHAGMEKVEPALQGELNKRRQMRFVRSSYSTTPRTRHRGSTDPG
jgi:hypothetical protein